MEFYNCGIAGGDLGNTIKIYDRDIDIYKPTHIVLMIGVNDSNRTLLNQPHSAQRYEGLVSAFNDYKANLERFYQITEERNIKFILCTPVPVAEYMESNESPRPGSYALMQGYANYLKDFAKNNEIEICDYHSAITEQMQSEILYDPDRVHPTPRGHEVMAQTFLAFQGIPYEETKVFPQDIDEWYSVSQKLRDTVAIGFMVVRNYLELGVNESMAIVKQEHDKIKDKLSKTDYWRCAIENYLEVRPHMDEYVAKIKQLMNHKE